MTRAHLIASWLTVASLCGPACDPPPEPVEIRERTFLYRGVLKDGKKHGLWIVTDPDGLVSPSFVSYEHGLKHGQEHAINEEDGTLFWDKHWVRGRQHGRDRVFWDNRELMHLGWYRWGEKIGYWCYWDEDGRLTDFFHYGEKSRDELDPRGATCPLIEGRGAVHRDPRNLDYQHAVPPRSRGRVHRRVPMPNTP